jgi:glutaredoxin
LGGDAPAIAKRPAHDLVVYAKTTFCPDWINTRAWLENWNTPFRVVFMDMDEEIAARLDNWLGTRTVPTLVIAERNSLDPISEPASADLSNLRDTDRGSMMHEPEEASLHAFLVRNGILPE